AEMATKLMPQTEWIVVSDKGGSDYHGNEVCPTSERVVADVNCCRKLLADFSGMPQPATVKHFFESRHDSDPESVVVRIVGMDVSDSKRI
ncbi:hypothetical protein Dimus_036716, partial [Dionaea muscipula]